MSSNIRTLRPEAAPLVGLGIFQRSPTLYAPWNTALIQDACFMTDRYWYFPQDPEGRTAQAIARIALEIIELEEDLEDFDLQTALARDSSAYLSFTRSVHDRILEPELVVTGIIEATNMELSALRSPYILPLK